MVKATTALVGIIGQPIGHSLSPAMHNAAFRHLAMDWAYVAMPVDTDKLEAAVKGLAALGFCGVNVTVPHKERVVPYLDRLSDEAARIGAVNTLKIEDGKIVGDNTDAAGFINDVRDLGLAPSGLRALILGAGGSSRAVAYALASQGAEVTVCGRRMEAASELVDAISGQLPGASVTPLWYGDLARTDLEADLMVNTTPVGMHPVVEASPWPKEVAFPACRLVYDLVYHPRQTSLMEQAAQAGIAAVNGLGMLIHQAALSSKSGPEFPLPLPS